MSAQPSVNFRHLSIFCWTFCKLTSNLCSSEGSSVNFLCIHGTFGKLLSTFLESAGHSVNFRHISVGPRDLPSTFHASMGPSVNIPCLRRTFSRLPSTFVHPQYLPSTSVNILCTRGIFRKQSARPQNLPSTSVDFPCICGTYRKLASTFREAGGPPVNILCIRRTCQLSSTSLYYSVVQAVQQSFLPQTHEIFSYDSWCFHYSVV